MSKISIIIPVYNVEKYLSQCIDSVINQTYRHIEIILVNDGSTDSSGIICDKYSAIDTRVKVFHIENKGVSNARNIGIENATAPYIMFLDSDDWIENNTCEVAYEAMITSKADILFWSYFKDNSISSFKDKYLENQKQLINENPDQLKLRVVGMLGNQLTNPVKTDAFNTPWAKLYRKEIIIENNLRFRTRNEVGMEDVLFNIEVINKSKRFRYLNKYFNHYRLDNPNSLTKVDTNQLHYKFENLFKAIDKIEIQNPRKNEALNSRIACSCINIMLAITHPNNKKGIIKEIQDVTKMLESTIYIKAFKDFSFKFLPFHWRIFFFFCKQRMSIPLYLLSKVIRILK